MNAQFKVTEVKCREIIRRIAGEHSEENLNTGDIANLFGVSYKQAEELIQSAGYIHDSRYYTGT